MQPNAPNDEDLTTDAATTSAHTPVAPPEDQQLNHEMAALGELFQRHHSGATWFYWVAALSIINTLLVHFQAGLTFIFGMGATLFVDGMAIGIGEEEPELATTMVIIAIAINVVICGLTAGVGWLSLRGHLWAFAIGTFLYLLDGLFILLIGDMLGAAFHGFVLFFLVRGLLACKELRSVGAFSKDLAPE